MCYKFKLICKYNMLLKELMEIQKQSELMCDMAHKNEEQIHKEAEAV